MLTAEVITAATPLVLGTLVKHYLARRSVTKDTKARDDLVYDEVFVLLKTFMEIASKHTVEDLQRLTLTTAPSPPYVLIHRLLIPLDMCHSAAKYLIQGLGGEDKARDMVGGTKWWQVRGLKGVEAEWIGIKRDWKADEERRKREEGIKQEQPNGEFAPEMDSLRCMLYIHGGAYYWGSINTHRYTIWRYARKMKGRCFAVNYRKSPQYPFPCAIQDCLAAYLYLLNPPPGAKHRPIDPKNLVIAGDSAGGGLVLALLQIIRDTGLAMPAGAILISPWSDLTHSFPSILQNTATDIVPPYGFIHRPSTLWPPPPLDLTREMQKTMRTRVKDGVNRLRGHHSEIPAKHDYGNVSLTEPSDGVDNLNLEELKDKTLHPVIDTGDTHHHPDPQGDVQSDNPSRADPTLLSLNGRATSDTLELDVKGDKVTIKTQIQLYCTNAQLTHPLVSPALGYLGGLCPLLVIAGDKEVLRDEIVYVAHKAAHPERYPLKDNIRKLQPCLEGIEERFGPTEVHLQVYDEVCHVLPLLSMTKPARGCYRAIASFARYVTAAAPASRQPSRPLSERKSSKSGSLSVSNIFGLSIHGHPSTYSQQGSETEIVSSQSSPTLAKPPLPVSPPAMSPDETDSSSKRTMFFTPASTAPKDVIPERPPPLSQTTRESFTTALSSPAMSRSSSGASVASISSDRSGREGEQEEQLQGSEHDTGHQPKREVTGDDAGPRFGGDEEQEKRAAPGTAGHPGIYRDSDGSPFKDSMIRERVAIDGVCRPLDAEEIIESLHMPLDQIGVIKEAAAMRYITGQALWDKKYHRDTKRIAKRRAKHLAQADNKDSQTIQAYWEKKMGPGTGGSKDRPDIEDLLFDNNWTWTWAFEGENPPPSTIVSRRDFSEARVLARMADRLDDESANSHAVNLWVALASFFSSSTIRDKQVEAHGGSSNKLAEIEREEADIREEAKRRGSTAADVRAEVDSDSPSSSGTSTPSKTATGTPVKGGFRKLSSFLKGSK